MQKLNEPKSVHMDTYILRHPNATVWHEYNATGSHRIRVHDPVYRNGETITTAWFGYEDIVVLSDERTPDYRREYICATTEYYSGVLPRVFRATEAEKI